MILKKTTLILAAAAVLAGAASISPVIPKKVDGCYQIGSAAELYGFAAVVNGSDAFKLESDACGKLTANIVVNQNVLVNDTLNGDGSNFVPWTPMVGFSGKFDGQFHTISGLYFNDDSFEYAALFSTVKGGVEGDSIVIANVGLEDSYILGKYYAAGLVGRFESGYMAIENVYNMGLILSYINAKGIMAEMGSVDTYLNIRNAYNAGPLDRNKENCDVVNIGASYRGYTYENIFERPGCNIYTGAHSTTMTMEELENGTIAALLRYNMRGKGWGQNVGVDKHPVFSDEIKNYAGKSVVSSLAFHNVDHAEDYPDHYVESSIVQLPVPERDGYLFIKWFTKEGLKGDTLDKIIRSTTGDLDLYAMWGKIPEVVDGCYEIGTVEELYGFAEIVRQTNVIQTMSYDDYTEFCAKLTDDIAVDTVGGWTRWFPIQNFLGTFDGNGKTISGLYYNTLSSKGENVGFIGSTVSMKGKKSVVKDLGLLDYMFKGERCAGAIVGSAESTDILRVYSKKGSVEGGVGGGGIAGCTLYGVKIEESYNEGSVYGRVGIGGLVGMAESGTLIANSYNTASMNGSSCCGSSERGGLIGDGSSNVKIINSFNLLTTSSAFGAGGLVGRYGSVEYYNAYALGQDGSSGIGVTESDYEDGTVAYLLREYKDDEYDGSMWGQHVGIDKHPVFTENITFNDDDISLEPKIPELKDGCFQIGSVNELYGFTFEAHASVIDSTRITGTLCGKLTEDIVVNENLLGGMYELSSGSHLSWRGIRNFKGIFDGDGHTIYGLYMNGYETYSRWEDEYLGFFESVYNTSETDTTKILNLGIEDSYFRSVHNKAGLICQVKSDSGSLLIKGTHVDGLFDGSGYAAGFVEESAGSDITIVESYFEGKNIGYDLSCFIRRGKGDLHIRNSYCDIDIGEDKSYIFGSTSGKNIVENSFIMSSRLGCEYDEASIITNSYAIPSENDYLMKSDKVSYVTPSQLRNGTVAKLLHDYKSESFDGSVWGQNVGVDDHPVLSGVISNLDVKFSKLVLVTYDGDKTLYADEYAEGIALDLPVPVRNGYVFKGWYDNDAYEGSPVTRVADTVKGEATYYSKWWHIPTLVDDCYDISSEDELFMFAAIVNGTEGMEQNEFACGSLSADIVLNEQVLVDGKLNEDKKETFVSWPSLRSFGGKIYGNGHSISGLYGTSFINFVGGGSPSNPVLIDGLGIKDSFFKGTYNVAGFIGDAQKSYIVISNSYNEATVEGVKACGGFVGSNDETHVFVVNSHNSGVINCDYDGGGLVGLDRELRGSISIMDSYNEGPVTGLGQMGGLVGMAIEYIRIVNSYNVGDVSGKSTIGGFLGRGADTNIVINSYNKGSVTGDELTGALFGRIYTSLVSMENSYYVDGPVMDTLAKAAAVSEFEDGSLAKKLHDYEGVGFDGSVWGQKPTDSYPKLNESDSDKNLALLMSLAPISSSSNEEESSSSSDLQESSSSKVESSSSEDAVESSSSAKSSSSVESSSSVAGSSSSGAPTSSSSSSAVGSSSSGNVGSSSSTTVVALNPLRLQSFDVNVFDGMVQIVNGPVGQRVALMDMQGRVISIGRIESSVMNLNVPQSGSFVLRVANQTRVVNVR